MQRLFSMFPTGRPGFALLILRIALALMLLERLTRPLGPQVSEFRFWIPVVLALALWLGLLTPLASALSGLVEIGTWAVSTDLAFPTCAALVAVALALLGPGAFSVDGRLFGRRQIFVNSRRTSKEI